METPNYPWSLWAYCPTTKKNTLVARGPESEMRNIFDRLVRRDDRLALVDAAGDKQSTTAGPLTDSTGPEAINCRTLQLDFPPGRLNALTDRIAAVEQTTTTIARRLDTLAESVATRHDETVERLGALEESTAPTDHLIDRLNALADLLGDHERRLSNLETAQPSEPDYEAAPLGPNASRLNAIEQTNATIARRLLAIERKQSEDRKIRESYQADQARRLSELEQRTQGLAENIKRYHDEGRPVREAVLRFDAFTPRINRLEQLTKGNCKDITSDRTEARNLAETVGNIHHDLKGAVGDLRRDLETLAAQVDETAKAVAKLATAQAVERSLRDEPAGSVDELRNQCNETAAAVAKITSALSILSAFNRPTAPPNA
jgi:DNA repair exonuclease SbcCD ATPase subunit